MGTVFIILRESVLPIPWDMVLRVAGLITSMFDLPWVNVHFFFYISIVVILLTEMFEIKIRE